MKVDYIFLIVLGILIAFSLISCKNDKIEKMANVSDDIKEGIRQIYLADVDAIRNLSEVAKKLQAGGLTNPGNLAVNGFINSTSISRIGGDWLRINNEGGTNGRTALYGNLSVNGTMDGHSGLSVGTWGDAGEGNIKASGDMIAGAGVVSNNVILNGQDLGGPGDKTRINAQGIIFGGANNGREGNSAQISAGRHEADSLCIVGMSDANKNNRKITMWAEGGAKLYGNLSVSGELRLAPIYRKHMPGGYYHVRGYGRKIPLYYGWNLVWNDHSWAEYVRKNVGWRGSSSSRFIHMTGRDLREGGQNDQNWTAKYLAVLPGYKASMYYWTPASGAWRMTATQEFGTGEYDWENTIPTPGGYIVHFIALSLIEEGPPPGSFTIGNEAMSWR